LAGIIKVDTIQSDTNVALKIATANVAFLDATGLNMVGGNLTVGGTSFISGGEIQTSAIADGAITGNKIATGSVQTDKIDIGAVTTDRIADGNVTTAKISADAITTDKIADGNVTAAKIDTVANTQVTGVMTTAQVADSAITVSKLATTVAGALGTRNLIINGDMRIDQRNAGSSVTITTDTYTLDRWAAVQSQSSKYSVQQDTDAPNNSTNGLKVTSLSAYTVGASENFFVYQPIEGLNIASLGWGTANAKTVTLSFWVKSSLTGTFGGALRNSNDTRSYPFEYSISSANTWEQKSVTISGDTAGTWLTTNGVGIKLGFGLGVGTTRSGTAGSWASANYRSSTGATSVVGTSGATWQVSLVQLEVGDTATPFEHRPYDVELNRCLRYYFKHAYDGSNTIYGVGHCRSNYMRGVLHLPIPMRTNPTMSNTGTDADYELVSGGVDYTSFVQRPTRDGGSPYVVNFRVQVSSLTNGHAAIITMKSTSSYLDFSAEL